MTGRVIDGVGGAARAVWLAGLLSLALAGAANADPPGRHGDGAHEGPQGRWGAPPGHLERDGPPGRWDHGVPPGHWERGAPNAAPPGWDSRRYNGYWIGRRWYYGAPSDPAFADPAFRPGFTPWRAGAYLPPTYQAFGVEEYWRFHLRRPPSGYHWVQVGDEFLLVSASTGQIFDVVTGF